MDQIKRKIFNGVVWTNLANLWRQAGAFLTMLVLAGLLTPKDFGIIGATQLALGTLERLSNSQVSAYLIYKNQRDKGVEDAAFQLQVLVGIAGYSCVYFLAPAIARFFNDAGIVSVLRVLGLQVILLSLKAVPSAIIERQLDFKKRVAPDMVGIVSKTLVTIVLALAGLGIWSVVAGILVGELIITAMLFARSRWLPSMSLQFDGSEMKRIIGYSKNVQAAVIITFLMLNMDYSIVGRYLGIFSLGIYTFAFTIANLPAMMITQAFNRVMFPAYARLETPAAVGRAFLKSTKYISLLVLPISIGFFFTVPSFLTYAYGDKWVPAIPVLRVLLVLGIARALFSGAGEVFKALGRPDLLFKINVFLAAGGFIALLAWGRHGIVHVAVVMASMAIVGLTINLWLLIRLTGFSLTAYLHTVKHAFIGSLAMGGLLSIAQRVTAGSAINELLGLVSLVGLGAAVYGAAILILDHGLVKEIRGGIVGGMKDVEEKGAYVKT